MQRLPRDFVLFAIAATLYAFSQSAVNSVFTNFLNDTYTISNFQRGLLEMPRETPGFLVVFVSALLYLMSSRRLAALAISVGMARATYLKRIAVQPDDVSQTLMMGVSIDHLFPIMVAALGGIIWLHWGYDYVFLLGVAIACVNLVSASRVRISQ